MELFESVTKQDCDSSSRKSSLIDTINYVNRPVRKDSVSPLYFPNIEADVGKSGKSTPTTPDGQSEKKRRLSRKLSLKPPTNVYRERRESQPSKYSGSFLKHSRSGDHHTVTCECGREVTIVCKNASHQNVPSVTLSTFNITDSRNDLSDKQSDSPGKCLNEPGNDKVRRSSIKDAIQSIKENGNDIDKVFQSCIDIGTIKDNDSLEIVLTRQNAIKSLLEAIKQYPRNTKLLNEACTSLLNQVEHSEASLHYLVINDGIKLLRDAMNTFPEETTLLATILDIFGYLSAKDEWRDTLSEKVNQSYFLTTMARHGSDVKIVQKCCVVIGNLVLSADLARSLMYVGGVHSIISMMNKYNTNTEILKHCCTALGTFASHDDTCQAVAEAGATIAVMSVIASFPDNAAVQESCCWALASLSRTDLSVLISNVNSSIFWKDYLRYLNQLMAISRNTQYCFKSDCACMGLMLADSFAFLLRAMTKFSHEIKIQEYGCWALCNLVALGSRLDDSVCNTAMETLIKCCAMFTNNVELLEHICYAINRLVSIKESVQETVVREDGISRLIELMRTYEDNIDIQVNSIKVIGNLAVNVNFRRYLEDMGASEAIISCMLKMDKETSAQNTGCMALTNLSADVLDNKYRILKNGGVNAVLNAMSCNMDHESIQLNALKVLCNLVESDKGCWWIAEESGVQIISMTLKKYSSSRDILTFGVSCLANLPRKGMNTVALASVEATLLYLNSIMSTCTEEARAICCFYENAIKAGKECKKMFTKQAMEKVIHIMQQFDDIDIQVPGCTIMAQVALDDEFDGKRKAAEMMISTMKKYMPDCNVQLICCGTISYLSNLEDGIVALRELNCIETVLETMRVHERHSQIHSMCLFALENICRADLVRGKLIQQVCDAVSTSIKEFPDNQEIQLSGSHILAIIGTRFHKQNVDRRKSIDCLGPNVGVVHRKSVTDEILQVASSAIMRIKRFTDDMLETSEDETVPDSELKELNSEHKNISPELKEADATIIPETTTYSEDKLKHWEETEALKDDIGDR